MTANTSGSTSLMRRKAPTGAKAIGVYRPGNQSECDPLVRTAAAMLGYRASTVMSWLYSSRSEDRLVTRVVALYRAARSLGPGQVARVERLLAELDGERAFGGITLHASLIVQKVVADSDENDAAAAFLLNWRPGVLDRSILPLADRWDATLHGERNRGLEVLAGLADLRRRITEQA